MLDRNKRIRDEAQAESILISGLAQKCFTDPKFQRYRDRALRGRERIIKLLMDYDEPDPLRYAMNTRAMLVGLKHSQDLLRDVEKDLKREERNNAKDKKEKTEEKET